MRSLAISWLSIRDFRNLRGVDIELSARFNLVFGDNGQGKTNLLEAVYVLATSRSFRTSKLAELVAQGADAASLRAGIREGDTSREQTVGLRPGLRVPRIDGKRPASLSAYAVSTPAVVFHPGSLALSAGSGLERRRLLDRVALYASASALVDVERYGHAMRARQRVLDMRGAGAGDLDSWETLMVQHGCAMISARAAAADRLIGAARRAFEHIGPAGLPLDGQYRPGAPAEPERFIHELRSRRAQDRARGGATVGPHRDDVVLALGGQAVRGMASQGQHRAVVLALELAEIEVVTESRGARPVLLLDDVSSELDGDRTAALLVALQAETGQVVVTTTRPELLDLPRHLGVERAASFRVVRGEIARA